MKKIKYLIAPMAICALLFLAGYQQQVSPESQTKAIVAAANAFLNTLSADQRKTAQMEFLRTKFASPTQFNMPSTRGAPGAPPNGGPPPNRDTSHRGNQPPGNAKQAGPPASGEQYGKA